MSHWQPILHFCFVESSLSRSKFTQTTTQHYSTGSRRSKSTANVFHFEDVYGSFFNANAWRSHCSLFLRSIPFTPQPTHFQHCCDTLFHSKLQSKSIRHQNSRQSVFKRPMGLDASLPPDDSVFLSATSVRYACTVVVRQSSEVVLSSLASLNRRFLLRNQLVAACRTCTGRVPGSRVD